VLLIFERMCYFYISADFCYVDDEHSDREPKHNRHLIVSLQLSLDCRYEDDGFVKCQHLGQVRLSLLVCKDTHLVYVGDIDLRNCADGLESLHRSLL